MDDLIPPQHLINLDGTRDPEEFKVIGEGFTSALLVGRAHLAPTDDVLDIGCAAGQKARVLTRILTTGSYEGLDVVAEAIEWCREHYRAHPRFRFQTAEVYSSHYNPTGRYQDTEYRFPYADAAFDVVFLSSVFTHMLPPGVARYLSEIARVLRPGGRCLSTFFLLNEQQRRQPPLTSTTIQFPHAMKGCRVRNAQDPSEAIAHPEEDVRRVYARAGLRIAEIAYGTWCGGKDLLGALQDSIIALKE